MSTENRENRENREYRENSPKSENTELSTKKPGKDLSRRNFLNKAALTTGAFMFVPSAVLGRGGNVSPNDKANIAVVGAGGKGFSDTRGCAHENIYAICDVDDNMTAKLLQADWAGDFRDKAVKYRDYREMLDNEPELDAVIVSTPDHMHAPIAIKAMEQGLHIYAQKPMCHTVAEARAMMASAARNNVVTQMGNQGHAGEGARLINEWIADGAVGRVHKVHSWTNRPIWPQGISRPAGSDAIPNTLDWDLWLGAAPQVPHLLDVYHPFNWRGWYDYGCGALGDMGAHIMDHPFWALDLDLPTRIQGSSTRWGRELASFPVSTVVHYDFAAKGANGPIRFTWSDGGIMPERPQGMANGKQLGDNGGGSLIYGDKSILMHSTYGGDPQLVPAADDAAYTRPAPSLPRSSGIYQEWIDAIKDRSKTTQSNFAYAGKLCETMLLGNIAAMRQFKDQVLRYDAENMRFTNNDNANEFLTKTYRDGFGIS